MSKIKEITIIGYGNQAKAWASNLRDSGLKVYIALREDSPSVQLVQQKFQVVSLNKELPTDFAVMLTPDESHPNLLQTLASCNKQLHIIYAHGYSLYASTLAKDYSQFKHILLAPKCIAAELRFRYEHKEALTCFYSLEYVTEDLKETVIDLSQNLGAHYCYPSSFKEETQADLFSEQTILCNLLPFGMAESFKILIDKGYSEELAFFECFYEVKLIMDTIYKKGPKDFFNLISPNALIGANEGKKTLFDESFLLKMNSLLNSIEGQDFNKIVSKEKYESSLKELNEYWDLNPLTKAYSRLKDHL